MTLLTLFLACPLFFLCPGPCWYRRHRYTVPAASASGDSLLLTIVARAPSMPPFTFVVWRPGYGGTSA